MRKKYTLRTQTIIAYFPEYDIYYIGSSKKPLQYLNNLEGRCTYETDIELTHVTYTPAKSLKKVFIDQRHKGNWYRFTDHHIDLLLTL